MEKSERSKAFVVKPLSGGKTYVLQTGTDKQLEAWMSAAQMSRGDVPSYEVAISDRDHQWHQS